jgi:hypothetical protein
MRGRYPMSEQDEHKVADTPAPAARHARASLADLLAFLGVLVLAGALALLVDRTGQLSARLWPCRSPQPARAPALSRKLAPSRPGPGPAGPCHPGDRRSA